MSASHPEPTFRTGTKCQIWTTRFGYWPAFPCASRRIKAQFALALVVSQSRQLLMTWNYSGARVIVAGGAGFIGSHLCEILINLGSDVACVDNYLTGRAANLSSLADHPRFRSLDHDITSSFFSAGDAIFNLACPASPVWYQRDPVQTMRVNIIGSLNLLELARQNNARILQASTSEVYGDPASHPQSESYWGNVNPIGVRACYNEGKRCSET
jgi:UDP-glucuronate decarboxylase